MNWNYYNTFITVAADCPVEYGVVPPQKKTGMTKPGIEYELTAQAPYTYTQEDLLFEVHVRHKQIPAEEMEAHGDRIRKEFFAKPTACMRASMLPKKYGWGIHFNKEGKLALIPMESAEYQHLLEGGDTEVQIIAAMRNNRK